MVHTAESKPSQTPPSQVVYSLPVGFDHHLSIGDALYVEFPTTTLTLKVVEIRCTASETHIVCEPTD